MVCPYRSLTTYNWNKHERANKDMVQRKKLPVSKYLSPKNGGLWKHKSNIAKRLISCYDVNKYRTSGGQNKIC